MDERIGVRLKERKQGKGGSGSVTEEKSDR